MIDSKEKPDTRRSVSRFLISGVVIAGIGYLPLQMYIVFGPRDGNPVGLGLLFVIAVPAGLAVFAAGLIKLSFRYFLNRKGRPCSRR